MLAHKHEQPKTGLAVPLHRHYGINDNIIPPHMVDMAVILTDMADIEGY